MKRLYLVRHAKSSWSDPAVADRHRELNKRGKRDAPEMGRRLNKKGVVPDLMVSSPATRAVKTARKLADALGIPRKKIVQEEAIYSEGCDGILEVIRGLDDASQCVMVVGHNPDVTLLPDILCGHSVDNVPTCGVFCIEFDARSWSEVLAGTGRLILYDFPKKPESGGG